MQHLSRFVILTLLLSSSSVLAADWLQWGGPRGDFTVDAGRLAERWPADGPKTLWKRPLGSGYSSILYKDGRLFTMYRDGEDEVVAALDGKSGVTQWEHRYKPQIWPDMTHAFGLGPNATPLIVGNRIVAIGIGGDLRCLDLETGELQWRHDLPAEYGRRSRDEEYGYSGNPLLYEGKILVLVGGTDHAVVAFDPADGKTVWESEAGGISYAAPTLTSLGGRDQFIYFSPQGVVGLDPTNGASLWHSPMEYNNGNHLTPAVKCDDSHIWVGSQFPTGGGRLLAVRQEDERWTVEQLWFETYLRASHWTSIRIGDYIYGSTGGNQISVLTAFNWKSGKVAWRHRGFHKAQSLYADGKLLFLDEGGQLAIARVSPDGFELLDSAEVTESVSWSLPTLVDTTLYLRDQSHILALDLAHGGKERPDRRPTEPTLDESTLQGAFGEFVRKLSSAQEKKPLIDEFMAQQETFPIVEDGSLVHFVYRGEIPGLSVSGNFLELRSVEPLHRVPGTDFYFRSYRLTPGAHFEYRFAIFDDGMADPLNPRKLTDSGDGPSVFSTAGWSEAKHLREPTGPRGRIETFNWDSTILSNQREISIYLPAGYDASERRYALILVNYGDQALEQGKWTDSLDNLIGNSVAPVIAVFVPQVSFNEYAPQVNLFADAIVGELMPHIDRHYRTLSGAEHRAISGIASGGFASAFLALSEPDVFGKAAVQSFYFRAEAHEQLRSLIAGENKASFYVEWSLNDFKLGDGLRSEVDSRELARLLSENGHSVITNEVVDGAGWGSWRARTDRILESFFARATRLD